MRKEEGWNQSNMTTRAASSKEIASMPIELDRGHGELMFGSPGPPDDERLRAASEIVLRYGRHHVPRIKFTVLRGSLKGQPCQVHQMCNDWIVDHDSGKVINPVSTHFEPSEVIKVMALYADDKLGIMFGLYELAHFVETGRFRWRA
jgi:hypothetical protein